MTQSCNKQTVTSPSIANQKVLCWLSSQTVSVFSSELLQSWQGPVGWRDQQHHVASCEGVCRVCVEWECTVPTWLCQRSFPYDSVLYPSLFLLMLTSRPRGRVIGHLGPDGRTRQRFYWKGGFIPSFSHVCVWCSQDGGLRAGDATFSKANICDRKM